MFYAINRHVLFALNTMVRAGYFHFLIYIVYATVGAFLIPGTCYKSLVIRTNLNFGINYDVYVDIWERLFSPSLKERLLAHVYLYSIRIIIINQTRFVSTTVIFFKYVVDTICLYVCTSIDYLLLGVDLCIDLLLFEVSGPLLVYIIIFLYLLIVIVATTCTTIVILYTTVMFHGSKQFRSLSFQYIITVIQFHRFIENCFDGFAFLHFILLVLSGDVHPNPGPTESFGDLNLCHANIRSLSQDKLLCIKTSLAPTFDLIALSETFLAPHKDSLDYNIPGFHPIMRRDRTTGYGGGVALYASRVLVVKRRVDLESPDFEIMWVEVRIHNNVFLLAVVYRPPSCGMSFWDDFQVNVDQACNSGIGKIIIMGDLNADPRTPHGRRLLNFGLDNNLTIHVTEPTRITEHSSTCLDQILSNIPQFVSRVSVQSPVAQNDHCTVTASLLFRVKTDKPYERFIWQYSKANFDFFREKLNEVDWDACFDEPNVDLACLTWTHKFLDVARYCIPSKNFCIRQNDSPWYTSKLRAQKRKVHRIHEKAKASNENPQIWGYSRELRNKYISDLREAEENYHAKQCDAVNNGHFKSKKWWKMVKFFMSGNSNASVPSLQTDDDVISDSKSKAEAFNNFFLKHCHVDDSSFTLPSEPSSPQNLFDSITLDEGSILDILKSLNIDKACGPDGISPILLREAASSIAPSLTKLLNLSLQECKFPSEWKKAHVTPILKGGAPELCGNYRPISLLSCVGKVLERAVFKHIFNFLRDNYALSEKQSGFIPGDGTVNQLVYLYHEFSKAVDLQKEVRVVFCDITKAFDRVYHPGLIHKLKKAGIQGPLIHWIEDYLFARTQRVVIQGQASSWGDIRAGVPQGSVLGPLWFLVYVNDIVEIVNSEIRLFADDTTLYITVNDPIIATETLNHDLSSLSEWSNQWLVSFNPQKTKSLVVSRKVNIIDHPSLTFNNSDIENVNVHKHLGLWFSRDLSWSTHIDHMVAKSKKTSWSS